MFGPECMRTSMWLQPEPMRIVTSIVQQVWERWNKKGMGQRAKLEQLEKDRQAAWRNLEVSKSVSVEEARDAVDVLFKVSQKLWSARKVTASSSIEDEIAKQEEELQSVLSGIRGAKGEPL